MIHGWAPAYWKTNKLSRFYNAKLSEEIVFQGNLDPIKLLTGGKSMEDAIINIMKDMKEKDFIFNLGHGILPDTPIENVKNCIDIVKNFKR